jgi:hypothetical protein
MEGAQEKVDPKKDGEPALEEILKDFDNLKSICEDAGFFEGEGDSRFVVRMGLDTSFLEK